MEIKELYSLLKKAYTAENMHHISSRIIDLFKERKYDALRGYQKIVHEYIPCDEEKINKVFSRLIMIYHPDRLNQSIIQLEEAYNKGDFESLFSMSHILRVQHINADQLSVSEILTEEDLIE